MSYLTPADYKSQIRDEVKAIVADTAGGSDTLTDAELKAQSQIESYLNHRYDVAAIFVTVEEYDNAKAYSEGDYVYFDNSGSYIVRKAKGDTTGNEPTDTDHWAADDRHKHLISLMVDITLYRLYYANSPRSCPEHVQRNYDEALRWLEMVAKGKLNPGLPLIAEDPGNPVRYENDLLNKDVFW